MSALEACGSCRTVTSPLTTTCRHLQNPALDPSRITTSPSGSYLQGSSFTLTATAQATMRGGTLTVTSNPGGITCGTTTQTGDVNSLSTSCSVSPTAATGSYNLQVTWVTNALQSSTTTKTVPVVSAVPPTLRSLHELRGAMLQCSGHVIVGWHYAKVGNMPH